MPKKEKAKAASTGLKIFGTLILGGVTLVQPETAPVTLPLISVLLLGGKK